VHELVNGFLDQKQGLVDMGELSLRSWADYKDACGHLVTTVAKKGG
jgi:hypothetical protein